MCFVRNKASCDRCIACEGLKHGAQSNQPVFSTTPSFTSSFNFKDNKPKHGGFIRPPSANKNSNFSMGAGFKLGGSINDLKFGGTASYSSTSGVKSELADKIEAGDVGFGGVQFSCPSSGQSNGGSGFKFDGSSNDDTDKKTEVSMVTLVVPVVCVHNKVAIATSGTSLVPTFHFNNATNAITTNTISQPVIATTGEYQHDSYVLGCKGRMRYIILRRP